MFILVNFSSDNIALGCAEFIFYFGMYTQGKQRNTLMPNPPLRSLQVYAEFCFDKKYEVWYLSKDSLVDEQVS